jgi:hypothetical protein
MDVPQGNNLSAETLTGAPPPPQEVKVRTMASDLASVAASGGGSPQFQNLKIEGAPGASRGGSGARSKVSLIAIILAIVAVVILAVGGYLAYQAFHKNTVASPAAPSVPAGQ